MMDNISQAHAKYSLFDQIPLGVCVLQADLLVLYWNSCLEEWTQIPKSKILGTYISQHFPHFLQPKYANRLRQIFEGGAPTVFSSQLHEYIIPAPLPQGKYRIQHTTVTSLPSFNDQEFYALLSIQDVTDLTFRVQEYRNMRDRALAEAEHRQRAQESAEAANRIKDEFLAILSHEIRTPLNSILGWSQLMRSQNFDVSKTPEALASIERNARLQNQLINDLLDIAKILRGKLSMDAVPVDLGFVIEAAIDSVKTAAFAKSITIHPLILPIGSVYGDAVRLQQIVWNLLSNAIKFTPNGGRIEIRLERIDTEEEKPVKTNPLRPNKLIETNSTITPVYAQITVTDTGKGIKSDFLPYIFESFRQEDASTTRKYGGLGLGLAIVRLLVEAHGGTITAQSQGEDQGATFIVRLPLLDTGVNETKSDESANERSDLQGIRVLIVDDEPDTRQFLTVLLKESGAEVLSVSCASEVLASLATFPADVLVSDIAMPDMDGYTLLEKIRSLPPEKGGKIPAIALTAYARVEDEQRAFASGFQHHLSKPFDLDLLLQLIFQLSRHT